MRWLGSRLGDVPPSLRRRLEEAIATHGSDLRAVAARLLEEAKQGDGGRDTALTLLAADALVTYACELAADTTPERLGDLR